MEVVKRYLRIDIEYESSREAFLWATLDTLKRIIAEDIPYAKIIYGKDSPSRDGLERK